MENKNTVLAIGRWMPIHLGHKKFLVDLAKKYDKLIIGIGSCYENGTPRNCIPAVEREKLLRKIMKTEGIDESKLDIVQIQDKETFEEWIEDVSEICKKYEVTHFCTGNKEDILNVLKEKNIDLNLNMINPEDTSDFPYHATDVRNAILKKDVDFLKKALPNEIIREVITNVGKEIIAANKGEGKKFIPGRQTVDMVFSVRNEVDGKIYTLIGKRNKDKIDFPGYNAIPGGAIEKFASPVNAVSRVFLDETGLDISVIDNSTEPAKVKIENISDKVEDMHFIGIYASPDEKINGSRGGGSQCFSILMDGDIEKIKEQLFSKHDLEDLRFVDIEQLSKMKLAFEQKTMVFDAFKKLGIDYDKEEELDVLDENGGKTGRTVSRKDAHEKGILHGASHTYIYRKNGEKIEILLQRRSHNKDSFPDCLDISSAGHMESGLSFEETAIKELEEELGLKVKKGELTSAFKQRFSNITEHNGKQFNNQEINEIYLLRRDDLDISKVKLQEEEVSEVVWMDADEITKKLEEDDQELCLDKEEYLKVLEKIKEREKDMEDNNLTKEIYEDAILNGRFTNSKVIIDLGGKTNQYGERRDIEAILKSQMAAKIVKYVEGGDELVAKGIALGVELGKPTHGKIGEEFLKNKNPEYTKSGLGVALTKVMLNDLSGKKIDNILSGVEGVLEGRKDLSEEAKAAQIAYMIYNGANKYKDRRRFNEVSTSVLGKVLRATRDSGRVKSVDSVKFISEMDSEKDVVVRNGKRKEELDNTYSYLLNNFSEIPEEFVKALEGYSKEEIVAYYVVSMKEDSVSKLFEQKVDSKENEAK